MSYISRTAQMTTPFSMIEMMFGPVLPGTSVPEKTISVFRNRFSKNNYQMFGQVGVHADALFYVHTQLPIDLTKVKTNVIGISADANSCDEPKLRRIKQWLKDNAPELSLELS